ncbi:MAG: hypothetical protein KC619_32455 [Myxococcales bacterium]|nr:hypothetical protein [Myxococcales bacterium]
MRSVSCTPTSTQSWVGLHGSICVHGVLALVVAMRPAPSEAQASSPRARWRFDVPAGYSLGEPENDCLDAALSRDDHAVVAVSLESPVRGPFDERTATWLLEDDLRPSAGRSPGGESCAWEIEERPASAPTLAWICGGRFAALQHEDGRWLRVELLGDLDVVRAMVRSARPVVDRPATALSTGVVVFLPLAEHELVCTSRDRLDRARLDVLEVAPPGQSALTITSAAFVTSLDTSPGGRKIRLMSRLVRARFHGPRTIEVALQLTCADQSFGLHLVGEARDEASFDRLSHLLATARLAPPFADCTPSQAPHLKPMAPRRETRGWMVVLVSFVSVVAALLIAWGLLRLRR